MTASPSDSTAPIPLESAGDLLRRLEAVLAALDSASASPASPPAPPALAFDADGTLWEGDVGVDIFEAFLAARGARPEAAAALRREAETYGVPVPAGGGAHEAASALYDAFNAETYPEDRAFAMMAWAFAGWRQEDVHAFAEQVLEAKRIDTRVRKGLVQVLDWARSRGLAAYVVSASPRGIVERGVGRLGIAPERVFAMTPAIRGGRLEPELSAPPTYGDGKIHALERALPSLSVLAAFGDSAYDAPMLRIARVPVAVGPGPKLVALAHTIPGLVQLET